MKNFSNKYVSIPWALCVLIGLFAIIVLFIVLWYSSAEPKHASLLGGLVGGLIVFFASLVLDYFALSKLERYEKMGVRELLKNRHDKNYYQPIIRKAKAEVFVMGASCSRFVNDFLDLDSDEKVLVDGLRRHPNLTVRLLVPDKENMDGSSLRKFELIEGKLDSLKREFRTRFCVRRFQFEARHSFVIADGDVIAGPIFEGTESMHAPAVHILQSTAYGQKVRQYFDTVWRDCCAEVVESFDH